MNSELTSLPIFDFNIHLPVGNEGLEKRHEEDMRMVVSDIARALDYHACELAAIRSANYMLFNQYLTESDNFEINFQKFLRDTKTTPNSIFTLLVDFRHINAPLHIMDASRVGVKGIKFHSYLQKIREDDFPTIIELCIYAEKLGMFICIDTSFGTIDLYKYDNLKLAAAVAGCIKIAPVVLLHSGGARVLEAMLLADLQDNLYLETSLTLPFYEGSALWKNIAFAYRKLNCDRVLYATDFPYVNLEHSLNTHTKLFREFNFTSGEIEKIMYQNADRLLSMLQG